MNVEVSATHGLPGGDRRSRQTRLLVAFSIVSLVVHAAFFVGYAWLQQTKAPAIDLDAAVVKTRLVKLGKPRDEKLLPRLPTSPAPAPNNVVTPPKPELAPLPDAPAPEAQKRPSASDILNELKGERTTDIRDIIQRRVGAPDDEGKEDGDIDGTDLEGEIKATYFARVAKYIERRMEVSSVLTDDERVRLQAVLALRIDDDGTVLDASIQSSSGSTVFDSDVLAAARKSSPVPAPPPQVRAMVQKGIGLNFCPVSCK